MEVGSRACLFLRDGEDADIAKTLESGHLRQQQIMLSPSEEALHDMRLRLTALSGDAKMGIPVLPYAQVQFVPQTVDTVTKSIHRKNPSQPESEGNPPAPHKQDPLEEEKKVADQNRVYVHPSKRRLPGGRVIPVRAYAKNKTHRWVREKANVKRRVGSFGWGDNRVIKRSLEADKLRESLVKAADLLLEERIAEAGALLEKSGALVQQVMAQPHSDVRSSLIVAFSGLTADYCEMRDTQDVPEPMVKAEGQEEDLFVEEFDDLSKSGANEKGPSLKPPKGWFDEMSAKVKEENPDYSEDQVSATVGKIWYHNMSKKDRAAKRHAEGKKYGKAAEKSLVAEGASVDAITGEIYELV